MAKIAAFPGIRYDPERIPGMDYVLAPPYNNVSEQQETKLKRSYAYNAIRLELRQPDPGDSPSGDRYSEIDQTLRQWLEEGILIQDAEPCLYPYRQTYRLGDEEKSRLGLCCLVRLEEFERRTIMPHERTYPGPKADRLALMRACQMNFSPIFGLCSDGGLMGGLLEAATSEPPVAEGEDAHGVGHQLWALSDRSLIKKVASSLSDAKVIIADGHHRYESALAYRNEMRERLPSAPSTAAFNYVMMVLVSANDPGLTIFPPHRVVKCAGQKEANLLKGWVDRWFEVRARPFTQETEARERTALLRELAERAQDEHVFGMYCRDGHYYLLVWGSKPVVGGGETLRKLIGHPVLDVTLLHDLVLNPVVARAGREGEISYQTDAAQAVRMVDSKEYDFAFFINPPTMSQVQEMACSGRKMPHKSTYFYPKMPSGLVMSRISPDQVIRPPEL